MTWKVPAGPLKSLNSISAIGPKCTFLFETQFPLFLSPCMTGKRNVSRGAMMHENKLGDGVPTGHP